MGRPPKYTDEQKQEVIFLSKTYDDMTQEDIADRTGVHPTFVSRVLKQESQNQKNTPTRIIDIIKQKMTLLSNTIDQLSHHPVDAYTTRAIAYATKVYVDYAKQVEEYYAQQKANWCNFWQAIYDENQGLYDYLWFVIEKARDGAFGELEHEGFLRMEDRHKLKQRRKMIDTMYEEYKKLQETKGESTDA